MRCVVERSEAEEMTLQQLSINHKYPDTRTRATGSLQLARKVKPGSSLNNFVPLDNWSTTGHTHGATATRVAGWAAATAVAGGALCPNT